MLIDVAQKGGTYFAHCIDRLKLNIERVETKIEYFKTGNFEEKRHGVLEDPIERLSKFVSAGYLLIYQELCEIADNVLEFDFER